MPKGIYKRTEYHNAISRKNGFQKGNPAPKTAFKKGHKPVAGFSKGYIPWNKGKKCLQISKTLTGRTLSEKHKKCISKSLIGYIQTEERKENTRVIILKKYAEGVKMGFQKGSNHPSWIVDRDSLLYPDEFNEGLKEQIRKRDDYTCQLSGQKPAICVHHIDYDKKNCDPDNLITLSRGSNSRVNFGREYWTNYFKFLLA